MGRDGLGPMNLRSLKMTKSIRGGGSRGQGYWEEVVRRWKEGGQSVRNFCQTEGLRESAFYFWRRELTRRNPLLEADNQSEKPNSAPATSRRAKRSPAPARSVPTFLPVRVVKDSAMGTTGGVEIVLAPGRTVRVQAGFDRHTLAEVLAVLEVRPC
jgi:hypothetical protein